ncbi:MAG: phosphohistidine phosphatase SixA [Candidatus Thiodiazotropha sp.]
MKLYLVQHGEACSKDVDPDRPLTDQGRRDVDRLVAFLGQAGISADRVIHSGKLRALQTAERLSPVIAPGRVPEANGRINPNDDPKAFALFQEERGEVMLVVGHLPFMARLVSHLLIGDEEKPIVSYHPGSIICLEREKDMNWRLNWMIRPELLG